ncbi:MAG: helix-turn-helix domain-containing protein [Firmicutes bacterium]|nr:helix-turn-helix domain-containing protein [Bacillota bacterium]
MAEISKSKLNPVIRKIATLRDDRGWNNNRLAVESGLAPATVLNWFARNVVPKINALENLCKAFGVSMQTFFEEDEDVTVLTDIQKRALKEFDRLTQAEKERFIAFVQELNKSRRDY